MRPSILVIAGSDPSGGAGLSRDVDTIARLGGEARTVVTAVTAQTDRTVRRITCLSPDLVADQLEAAVVDKRPDAIKIGMLGNAAIIEALANGLQDLADVPIVLDPVLAASSGRLLLDGDGRRAMMDLLFPRVSVVTPNLPEAAALTQSPPATDDRAIGRQATALIRRGVASVLIKGGHGGGSMAVDHLFSRSGAHAILSAPRRSGDARGTGCALASAMACLLATGQPVEAAGRHAKTFVLQHRLPAEADRVPTS